jgi:hypothetical protein
MKTKIFFLFFLLANLVSAQEKPDLSDPQIVENAKTLVSMFDKIDSALAYKTPADSTNYSNLINELRNKNKSALTKRVNKDSYWYYTIFASEFRASDYDNPIHYNEGIKTVYKAFNFIHKQIGEDFILHEKYYNNRDNMYPGLGYEITFTVKLTNPAGKKIEMIFNVNKAFEIHSIGFEIWE